MLIENNDFEQLGDISVIKKENYWVGDGGGVSSLPRNKASQGGRTNLPRIFRYSICTYLCINSTIPKALIPK